MEYVSEEERKGKEMEVQTREVEGGGEKGEYRGRQRRNEWGGWSTLNIGLLIEWVRNTIMNAFKQEEDDTKSM